MKKIVLVLLLGIATITFAFSRSVVVDAASNATPKYIMWGSYVEDVLEKRVPYRQAHLDGLTEQKESGVLITIGPTKDNTKVFGIYEAENEETVRQLIENDPYWQNGIWTEYEVKEWVQAF